MTEVFKRDNWTVYLDGIIADKHHQGLPDAEVLLDIFQTNGLNAIHKLDGFFNVLFVNEYSQTCYFTSDLFCNRAWYIYKNGKTVSLSSTPLFFSEHNLDISLNRQVLYEQTRLQYSGNERTIFNEIERVHPGRTYSYSFEDGLMFEQAFNFEQQTDPALTLNKCADEITQISRNVISTICNHPKLKQADIRMPLTGGLDSRYILGELLSQGRVPKELYHIILVQADFKSVLEVSNKLKIPSSIINFYDLDTKNLTRRWIERSAGLINFHQHYLLDIKNFSDKAPSVSFDGYLMDTMVGQAIKGVMKNPGAPQIEIFNRTYTGELMLKALFNDSDVLKKQTLNLFHEEISRYKGEPWFKMIIMDMHHRGLHYLGCLGSMMADDMFSCSPGAISSFYHYMASAPFDVAGYKKAYLFSMSKNFPELAAIPGYHGVPFSEMNELRNNINHPLKKNLVRIGTNIKRRASKVEVDITEHAWLRKNKLLKKAHKNVVFDSQLAKDGHIISNGMKQSWSIHQLGGYQAWTLMSLLTSEVAYRLLVKKQSPTEVESWLFS